MNEIYAKERLILALDPPLEEIIEMMKNNSPEDVKHSIRENAVHIIDELRGKVGLVKVNYVYSMVPDIAEIIHRRGINVWLDGKYKDIPRSVEGWALGAVLNDIDMVTIHADGGLDMIKYATEAARLAGELKFYKNLDILAISVLTSIDDRVLNEQLDVSGKVADKVKKYASLAEKGGVNGIVASAQESPVLREELGPEMLIVTPGIKPEWAAKAKDQKRITTPYQAIKNGSTHLVVGSAIIKAENYGKTRAEAAEAIVTEIDCALSEMQI